MEATSPNFAASNVTLALRALPEASLPNGPVILGKDPMRRFTDSAGGGGRFASAGAADRNELNFDEWDDSGLGAAGFAARKELRDELDF